MKTLKIFALLGILATGTAFAQSNPANATATPDNSATTVAMSDAAPQVSGTWVPPSGQAIAPKTRAQVYNELVEAEKDGQLAYLNSTVYAHP
jgi:hypothetical protein